ncbi:MAG: hypothetical protein DRI61_00880 [Chloroflexi bacterium]|nr:MAG: hypothetical protein DRI61_00880 [Chloroflexota bacterium]
MLKEQEHRGRDSTGVAYITKNNNLKIVKKAVDPSTYYNIYGKAFKRIDSSICIGHNRAASTNVKEKDKDTEAHPFMSEDGQFALVHNGTLGHYEYIATFLDHLGHVRQSGVDSEVFVHILEELLKRYDREEAMIRFYSLTEGNILVLFKDGELWGIPSSAFYMVKINDSVLIASEKKTINPFVQEDADIFEPPTTGGMVKIWSENGKVKIKLWGSWEKSIFKRGEWVFNKKVTCDFCRSVRPCQQVTIDGRKYDRCYECFKEGKTKPVINVTPVTPTSTHRRTYYDDYLTFDYEEDKNKKQQQVQKTPLAICSECHSTLPITQMLYCTKCRKFFCISCFKDHNCETNRKFQSRISIINYFS